MTILYRWVRDRNLFLLHDSENNVRASRTRLPSVGAIRAVTAEEDRRRSIIVSLERALEAHTRNHATTKLKLIEATARLQVPRSYSWSVWPHTFEVVITRPNVDPFPDPIDANAMRSKRLVKCEEPHCALRGGTYEASDEEIAALMRVVEAEQLQVRNLESELGVLGRAISMTGIALDEARRQAALPIFLNANAFHNVRTPAILIPVEGQAGSVISR